MGGLPALTAAMDDADAAVRYWAAVGLGNLGPVAKPTMKRLVDAMEDDSPIVRVAAARALCLLVQSPQSPCPSWLEELKNDQPAVRLAAVLVLDEIGGDARPALTAIHEALGDKQSKYVVRVATHALDQLSGSR